MRLTPSPEFLAKFRTLTKGAGFAGFHATDARSQAQCLALTHAGLAELRGDRYHLTDAGKAYTTAAEAIDRARGTLPGGPAVVLSRKKAGE